MSAIALRDNPRTLQKPAFRLRKTLRKELATEESQILSALEELKKDLHNLYNHLNFTTNDELIDSYIYEIKAIHARYKFYLDECKERNIHVF